MNSETAPVLPGFHPDPTICRVDEDYYLACSSFEYFPGAPLFHSTDLVSWTQIGSILTRRTQFRRGDGRPSGGVYGSTLRHHDGRFWFITSNMSDPESGMVLVSTDDPRGEWSEPTFVPAALGIDPDLCWDADGTCYLTWNALSFRTGYHGVLQAPVDLTTGELLEEPYPVWQGSGLPAAEGPHLYPVDGVWYLLLAEGGTERGHSITIARGPSPRGPFEGHPANPIFTRRSTIHPVQSVGHADLVETADGDWAAVHLGTRPRGSTPGFHVLGRETFLSGIDWSDGWPVFVPDRYTLPEVDRSFVDDFRADALDARWIVPGGEVGAFTAASADGLRISADRESRSLAFRVTDEAWRAEAEVTGDGSFRLRIDDRHWAGLVRRGATVSARMRVGDLEQELGSTTVEEHGVTLRIQSTAPASKPVPLGDAGPDDLVLSVVVGEQPAIPLARVDGRYLSTEVASGFTGRVLALSALEPASPPLTVRTVRYTPDPPLA